MTWKYDPQVGFSTDQAELSMTEHEYKCVAAKERKGSPKQELDLSLHIRRKRASFLFFVFFFGRWI